MSIKFKWLSFGSLSLVYATMIMGVYLSSIHQSLSCPDWPLCPNGLFSLPEQDYIIEYIHRIFVILTAGMIYITAIFAYLKLKNMERLTILAGVLVTIQILIGALVVTTKLELIFVSIHLPIGVALFGITLLTFLFFLRKASTSTMYKMS
jgi:heme A synthase